MGQMLLDVCVWLRVSLVGLGKTQNIYQHQVEIPAGRVLLPMSEDSGIGHSGACSTSSRSMEYVSAVRLVNMIRKVPSRHWVQWHVWRWPTGEIYLCDLFSYRASNRYSRP